ncbi:hypothetical protein NC981_24930 [Leptolyngbya sp. DQ-M1]|uniref:hypothetical protein n=1 Tax=Leptolyngbya sp. DQ-M1 TaxID=2933920 RepID=UPI0032976A5D
MSVIESAAELEQPLMGMMDSSFIHKSGKQTFGLDWYYNGSTSWPERGLEVSLISVVNLETQQTYALSVEQTCNQADFPETTRLDQALDHLSRVQPHLPARVRYLAVDGAYAKEKFVTGVRI